MLDKVIELDKGLFLYLNKQNAEWLDFLMLSLSSYALWTIVFLLFGVLIFTAAKTHKVASILFYAGSVLTSTLFTNGVKLIIKRPRPIHEETWNGIIHNIERYSAAYSFFSSHAATTFCIATFVLCFFKEKRYIGYLAMLWAVGVSYSRIYVSKHYPLDVLVGTLVGILVGYLGYVLMKKFILRKDLVS